MLKDDTVLASELDAYLQSCVASMALLNHLLGEVKSPTDEIVFFVELLEWCGLMCELRQQATTGADTTCQRRASRATQTVSLSISRPVSQTWR